MSNTMEQFERCILYKEDRRDIYMYDQDLINKELEEFLIIMQDVLLHKCKGYNKLISQQNKLQNKIKTLNKFCMNIKNSNQLNKQTNNLIHNKNILPLSRNFKQNGITFNINTTNSINSTKNYYNTSNGSLFSEDSLHNSNDKKDETGIFDDLNSDSENEVEFDSVVDQNTYLSNYAELHNKVPKLNLKQIEYNKRKVKPGEVSEISLSRRIEHSSLREQIENIKFKIKLLKHNIKKKQERLKKYELKIEKVKTILNTLNLTSNNSSVESLPTIAGLKHINLTSRSCDTLTLNGYILSPRKKTQSLEEIKEEM